MQENFQIYTDGSCHTETRMGAWAAILLYNNKKKSIGGCVENTTHNRMELLAVIKALEFVLEKLPQQKSVALFSDSQYVVDLLGRKKKLVDRNFKTKKGNPIRNVDLLEIFFKALEKINVVFIKVKAHQRKTDKINYNREVDKKVRNIIREKLRQIAREGEQPI